MTNFLSGRNIMQLYPKKRPPNWFTVISLQTGHIIIWNNLPNELQQANSYIPFHKLFQRWDDPDRCAVCQLIKTNTTLYISYGLA